MTLGFVRCDNGTGVVLKRKCLEIHAEEFMSEISLKFALKYSRNSGGAGACEIMGHNLLTVAAG